jgi:hypothetical protein
MRRRNTHVDPRLDVHNSTAASNQLQTAKIYICYNIRRLAAGLLSAPGPAAPAAVEQCCCIAVSGSALLLGAQ